MKSDVDAIVAELPPPDKIGKGSEEEGDDYNAEEAAALAVAKALGIAADKVDVPALCSALRDFNATSVGPIKE